MPKHVVDFYVINNTYLFHQIVVLDIRYIPIYFHVYLALRAKTVMLWVPVTVHREQSMKREDQQDATISCLLLTSVSTCLGIIMPIFRRTKALLLHLVCCSGSAGCGW